MTLIVFTMLTLAGSLIWVSKGLMRLPVNPKILNLPVIFSVLFFFYYTQHYFVTEVLLDISIRTWQIISDDQISSAIAFLLFYFAVYWVAYAVHSKTPRRSNGACFTIRYSSIAMATLLIAVISLVVYIYFTGGLHQFLTNHREAVYADQWSQSVENITISRARILTGFLMTIAAVVGGYLAGTSERSKLWQKAIYYSLPLPLTLVKIALLSRGFFLPYALFFLSKSLVSKKRIRYFIPKLVLLSVLVFLGAIYSLQTRSDDGFILENMDEMIFFASNAINGLPTFLDTTALTATYIGGGLTRIFLELSPVPSFVFSSRYENNLTTLVFDLKEGSSAPMPFIGEAYFNIGWGGLFIAYLQGFVAAIVNSKVADPNVRDRGWWLLLYITIIYSYLYMPHSGLRSCTRPFVWALLFFGLVKFFRAITSQKRTRVLRK